MTAVAIVALYLVGLAAFLGLDILGKIPSVMFAFVVAGLGAVIALGFALPLSVAPSEGSNWFHDAALALAGLAAGGVVVILGRLPRAYGRGGAR